jgi:hypothetical protein
VQDLAFNEMSLNCTWHVVDQRCQAWYEKIVYRLVFLRQTRKKVQLSFFSPGYCARKVLQFSFSNLGGGRVRGGGIISADVLGALVFVCVQVSRGGRCDESLYLFLFVDNRKSSIVLTVLYLDTTECSLDQ